MKEKKPGAQGGPNSPGEKEEEKNAIEKLEDDFKGTIFNVLYVLLKDDETSHWKHIVEILLDFIQIYHYSFARFVIKIACLNSIDGIPLEVRFCFELCANFFRVLPCIYLVWKTRYHSLFGYLLYMPFSSGVSHFRCILCLLQFFLEEVCLRLANASFADSLRTFRNCSLLAIPW